MDRQMLHRLVVHGLNRISHPKILLQVVLNILHRCLMVMILVLMDNRSIVICNDVMYWLRLLFQHLLHFLHRFLLVCLLFRPDAQQLQLVLHLDAAGICSDFFALLQTR